MASRIIPNKNEKLTHYILDHYNKFLQCESCCTIWTSDGTSFMRDQGGVKNGMYYRQFRCKGKGKGQCSMSYTHEDFLSLATRQLGSARIEAIKEECGFTTPNNHPLPPLKRVHDGASTGYTPQSKKKSYPSTLRAMPPPLYSPQTPVQNNSTNSVVSSLRQLLTLSPINPLSSFNILR
jgi:hypothetical protein